MNTKLRAYAWLPEGTIGIGAHVPHGAFMIAAAPMDELYRAIRATARRDAVAPGCYSLPGSPADADQDQSSNPNRTAVTAFLAYRRTIRAYLNTNPDTHPRTVAATLAHPDTTANTQQSEEDRIHMKLKRATKE